MKLLLIEDDPALAQMLRRALLEEGHVVEHSADGHAGLRGLEAGGVDVCLLDLQLPGLDGLTLLARARAAGVVTPILVLTARDAVPDRVAGLRGGADDYLTKPFAFAELLARVEALARRGLPPEVVLRAGDLALDASSHRVTLGKHELALSEKQFALLEFLLRHRGRVVSRAMVLDKVFGYAFAPGTNIVDVHVAHLRQRIDTAGKPSRITTVRGVGYRFEDA